MSKNNNTIKFFIEQTHSTFKMAMEKVSEPLELIIGDCLPAHGSNNLNPALSVAVDQTCTSFRRNFSPFFLAQLLKLCHILWTSHLYGPLQVNPLLYWVEVWPLILPLQKADFVFLKPFCCGLAPVFWVVVLLHHPTSHFQLTYIDGHSHIILKNCLI